LLGAAICHNGRQRLTHHAPACRRACVSRNWSRQSNLFELQEAYGHGLWLAKDGAED